MASWIDAISDTIGGLFSNFTSSGANQSANGVYASAPPNQRPVKTRVIGGQRAIDIIDALARKLNGKEVLRLGFLEGATYPDGKSVPMIAFINEFGATINRDAYTTTIYRRINAKGDFLRKGRFVRKSQSNYATDHAVPAHTIIIPPRPFFRNMIRANQDKWGAQLGKLLIANNYDAHAALLQMGELMKGQLQQSIRDFSDPPNAPSTIARKGFNDPLIDTGYMVDHVGFEVTP